MAWFSPGWATAQEQFGAAGIFDQHDIEFMEVFLFLNDDQKVLLHAIWVAYLNEWNTTIRDEVHAFHRTKTAIRRRMQELGADYEGTYRDEFAPYVAGYDRFIEDARIRDAAFLADVAAILSPEQLERLPRAHNAKLRGSMLPTPVTAAVFAWPAGGTDVIKMAYLMNAIPADGNDLWVVPFEDAYLRSLERLYDEENASGPAYHRAKMITYRAAALYRDDAQAANVIAAQGRAAFRRAVAPQERMQEDIVDVNMRFLEALKEHVAHEDYVRVLQAFKQTAYPSVYPDKTSALVLYEAALSLDSITRDQRESLELFRERFEDQHARVSLQMERSHSDAFRVASQGGVLGDLTTPRCWEMLAEQERDRTALNETQWKLVATILDVQMMAELPTFEDVSSSSPSEPRRQ
ncbi:MAG: hypothetical protein ACR2GY_01175 [Phycisphaerales bacterium]